MVVNTLKRLTSGPKPVMLVAVILLAALYLMSAATQNSAVFSQLYSLILGLNLFAGFLLLALIGRNLFTLIHQYRHRMAGSRLTVRLLVVFVVLAGAPVSLLYYYSLQFLHQGIDSWFDVRVEEALNDALDLGRSSLEGRMREALRQTRQYANELTGASGLTAAIPLDRIRRNSDAEEMSLLTTSGKVLASSTSNPTAIVPDLPNSAVLRQVRQGYDYAALEPHNDRMMVRIAVPVPRIAPAEDDRLLHALFLIPEQLNTLAANVQSAYARYQELRYLRLPLKYSFTLTLSMVLLLSLLAAVWAAFFSARRLTAPITALAEGTRAVAAGNYDMRLPQPSRDEMGFLVRSFNEMTRKIALSRDEAQRSQKLVEAQRAYLEAVLGHLSSGVMTVGIDGLLHTANNTASQILTIDLERWVGHTIGELSGQHPQLQPFFDTLKPHLDHLGDEWRAEVVLFGAGGRQMLMCRGSSLPPQASGQGGNVIIFDDITALVQAQRDAAWGEVARRLAHEIKNPLTPIQLSAERLRHKYLGTMEPGDAKVLDSATHTIVQQVESMKEMVKAFTDYARTPRLQTQQLDLNGLIYEVLDLYRADEGLKTQCMLDMRMPLISADPGRLRQLLHNLLTNAREASDGGEPINVTVSTRHIREIQGAYVELAVEDNGPGFPESIMDRLFEPYVTTKTKGTGLGLAIVKKIVEEHGGVMTAENRKAGGACITIRLPIIQKKALTPDEEQQGSAA